MPENLPENLMKGTALTNVASIGGLATGLSKGQADILRRIVSDPEFRTSFYTDPVKTAAKMDVTISAHDLSALARLTPAQYDAVGSAIKNIAAEGDGTHTLAYAIAFAVVVALLVAMPDPGSVISNPIGNIGNIGNIGGLRGNIGGPI